MHAHAVEESITTSVSNHDMTAHDRSAVQHYKEYHTSNRFLNKR